MGRCDILITCQMNHISVFGVNWTLIYHFHNFQSSELLPTNILHIVGVSVSAYVERGSCVSVAANDYRYTCVRRCVTPWMFIPVTVCVYLIAAMCVCVHVSLCACLLLYLCATI